MVSASLTLSVVLESVRDGVCLYVMQVCVVVSASLTLSVVLGAVRDGVC